jgi:hypothetical protein
VGIAVLAVLVWAATSGHPAASPAAAVASGTPAPSLASASFVGSQQASGQTGQPPTPGPFPDAVEAAILAALPPDLAHTCTRGGTLFDASLAGFTGQVTYSTGRPGVPHTVRLTITGSVGGVTCHPARGASRLYLLAPYVVYDDASVYIGALASKYGLPVGSCATDNRAQEVWTSRSGSGMLACMNPYEGRPWIYFTFDKGKYLAFATRDDSDYAALYRWWEELKVFLP